VARGWQKQKQRMFHKNQDWQLLAWFLGTFGAHRFYIGKTGTAVVMLVLSIIGWATVWLLFGWAFLAATGIWAFIDFIFAVAGMMKDKEGKLIKNW
jgi:TM2 domain-containing membrane protein YozV